MALFRFQSSSHPTISGIVRYGIPGRIGVSCLVIVLLAGCSLESPKGPTWTVDLTIPIADRHYDLPYIIEHANQPELIWDSVSGARFEIQRTLDTIYIGENITFSDLQQTIGDSLGSVKILPDQALESSIALEDIYGGPVGAIPAFDTQTQRDFDQLTDIQQAEIAEGQLAIEVANNLGLALDSVEVAIIDIESAAEIGRAIFAGGIPAGQQGQAAVDLAGQTIHDRLRCDVMLSSPGGYLESTAGRSVDIAVSFADSLQVTSTVARLGAIERLVADTVTLSNEFAATSAKFQRGFLNLQVINGVELGFDYQLRFPDLRDEGGPVNLTGYLDAESFDYLSVDLQGIEYDNNFSVGTPLRVEAILQTSGSAGLVSISAADRFTVQVDIDSPVIESITGVLPPTVQAVTNLQTEVNLPDGFENVGLAGGEMQLTIVSSLPFPGEFSLDLAGDQLQALSVSGEIIPATEVPVSSYINVADATSLLSPVPRMITASGTIIYGDGVTSGTVYSTDYLVPSFTLVAPLSVYLDEVDYHGETEGIELPGESDDLAGRFGAASIQVEFENRLPFGVTIELRLASSRAMLPDNAELVLGPTVISPAAVDDDGRTTAAAHSSDVFTIAAEMAHLFEGDSLFVTEQIGFFSANGSVVTLRDSDYIDWRALLTVETKLGDRN